MGTRRRKRSRWTGIGDANAAGDRKPWFEPGLYDVEIQQCNGVEGRKGGLFFVVEAKVLKIYETSEPKKMRKGSVYSQIINFDKDMGPINVKRFILAAEGLDPNEADNSDEVGEEEVEYAVHEDQPFAGTRLRLQCDLITTKAGNPFTKYTWMSAKTKLEEEEDEEEDDDEYEDEDEDEDDEEGAA